MVCHHSSTQALAKTYHFLLMKEDLEPLSGFCHLGPCQGDSSSLPVRPSPMGNRPKKKKKKHAINNEGERFELFDNGFYCCLCLPFLVWTSQSQNQQSMGIHQSKERSSPQQTIGSTPRVILSPHPKLSQLGSAFLHVADASLRVCLGGGGGVGLGFKSRWVRRSFTTHLNKQMQLLRTV